MIFKLRHILKGITTVVANRGLVGGLFTVTYLRGHSTTTWTKFCPFLTPSPPCAWTVFIPWAWTKTDIFWPLPPSSCPRSYWMPPNNVWNTLIKKKYNIRTFCLLICGLERFFNRALPSRGLLFGLCLLPLKNVCLLVLLCQCWFPLNYWNIIVSQIHTNNECFVYKAFIQSIHYLHA